jgi:hypothetical protein
MLWILAGLLGAGSAAPAAMGRTRPTPGSSSSPAPPRTCGTFEFTKNQRLYLFWLLYVQAQRAAPLAQRAEASTFPGTIPVAFHVLHDGPEGWVPQEDVEAQIEVLNRAYPPIQFVLASLDYTDNADWFRMSLLTGAEWQAKRALQLDPRRFLNVYTVDPGNNLLGWAIFPYISAFVPVLDGATVVYTTLPNGSEFGYNQGDTLVHEVGHWAGLLHTFGLGFECSQIGDLIADTPGEFSAAYECDEDRDTCPFQPGNDPVHNYMDYTDDDCADHFTQGQYNRMVLALALFRLQIFGQLLTPPPGS